MPRGEYDDMPQESSGEDRGATRLGKVPLLAEEIEIDDKGVTLVFIFPRCQDDGGVVNPDAERRDPRGDAHEIFYRNASWYPKLALFEELDDGPMPEGRYQEAVRSSFLTLLQKSGMVAQSTESIDRDEVFLKVSMGTDNPQLGLMAEHYRYVMPISEKGYQAKRNSQNMQVPAFSPYTESMAGKMCDFRRVDEIRLCMRWISNRVNLEQMRSQGVLVTYFPAAEYRKLRELHRWADLKWSVCLPNPRDGDRVREYFGERIAFLFTWFASYNKYMVILAVVSLAGTIDSHMSGFAEFKWSKHIYAICLVAWIAAFNELFKRNANRLKQKWGMKDWDSQQSLTLPSYRPHLDGTTMGDVYKVAATSVVVLYVTAFAVVILAIDEKNRELRESGDMRFAEFCPVLVSVVMKVSSFLWGKVANRIVLMQNHRTATRHDDALAWTLAVVKLFVAVFPFLEVAFLQGPVNMTCGDTLAHAAAAIYTSGFPTGTPLEKAGANLSPANITSSDLAFLTTYSHKNPYGRYCISGCYPAECWSDDDGPAGYDCRTICWNDLKQQLAAFYMLQVVSSLVFLVIPIVLTKAEVVLEMAGVMGIKHRCCAVLRSLVGMRLTSNTGSDSNGVTYSLLQYQAKCSDTAPYKYGSYGGSFVEDFLELAIGYTLQACFNQVLPVMAIIGVFAHMLLYRILAYRMLNITCRPFPTGAEGIGIWQDILDTIGTLAVTCNVAIATMLQAPTKYWTLEHKLIFFILAEKGLYMIRGGLGASLPDEPDDAIRIEDYNAQVAADLTTEPMAWASKEHDYSRVDVGIYGAPGTSSSDDSDESNNFS